ncbi:hypothetical protein [Phenylobacterium sp.]|uniref:hypothetical protein n=1 Tax=Phenylobacterium sp. TaxID=1871053 RepID=UPI00286B5064|nr:hypothetical protein [Phenylobacterium sp.]
MSNLIWPSARSPDDSGSARFGRAIHWMGVILAAALLITAAGFVAGGWAVPLAARLALVALAVAVIARAVRYILARE